MIVGPPSSGKTALVRHLLSVRSEPQRQPDSLRAVYLNCRTADVSSPESFAAALLEAAEQRRFLLPKFFSCGCQIRQRDGGQAVWRGRQCEAQLSAKPQLDEQNPTGL